MLPVELPSQTGDVEVPAAEGAVPRMEPEPFKSSGSTGLDNLRKTTKMSEPYIAMALETAVRMAPGTGDVISLKEAWDDITAGAEELRKGNFKSSAGHAALAAFALMSVMPVAGEGLQAVKGGMSAAERMVARNKMIRELGFLTNGDIVKLIDKEAPNLQKEYAAWKEASEARKAIIEGAKGTGLDVDELLDSYEAVHGLNINHEVEAYRYWVELDPKAPAQFLHSSPANDIESFSRDLLGKGAGGESAKHAIFASNHPGDTLPYAKSSPYNPRRKYQLDKGILKDEEVERLSRWAEKYRIRHSRANQRWSELYSRYEQRALDYARERGAIPPAEPLVIEDDFNFNLPFKTDAQFEKLSKEREIAAELASIEKDPEYLRLFLRLKKRSSMPHRWLEKLDATEKLLHARRMNLAKGAPTVYPVHIRAQNPKLVNKRGTGYGDITKNVVGAERAGHDATIFFNIADPTRGATHVAVSDPALFRSVFAKFDPEKLNDPNLLASIAALAIAGKLSREED